MFDTSAWEGSVKDYCNVSSENKEVKICVGLRTAVAEVLGCTLLRTFLRGGNLNKGSDSHSYLLSIQNVLQDL